MLADESAVLARLPLRIGDQLEFIQTILGTAGEDAVRRLREGMRELLGIVPADDAVGCLQDIHWSFGGIKFLVGM